MSFKHHSPTTSLVFLLVAAGLMILLSSKNTNQVNHDRSSPFFFVSAQQPGTNKPANSSLHIFSQYHTASLAPGALLYKQFTPDVYLTYEVECYNRPCDVLLIKTKQDYFNWRSNYYNTAFMIPDQIKYGNIYTYKIDYQTTSDVVLVIANPKNATAGTEVWYNYKTADVASSGGIIAAIVIGSLLAICLCLCCLGVVIYLLRLRTNPRDYMPQQDLPREF
ncbi:hypothetical protein FDP41_004231 [Naegleria fowleri]|uniref:Uncharacterized protein n=1 Tax=Naegleria fowleri TaxID=5763 RepID=A0A6A5BPJ9_NAEFO|nr:uncharacterized protein FDP41_004231 [Naegleria fowleri]KAF0976936.1 hypothetical protein FDP41_004231 [Naegleria fowleri]CAG4709424.1 unnamed protein product [Naegleria fowleri]